MSVPPTAPNPGGNPVYYMAPPPSYNEAIGAQPLPAGFKPVGEILTGSGGMSGGPNVIPLSAHYGPEPMTLNCPNCGVAIETSTRTEPGLIAWVSGVLIFLFGFWCGCCLIPCCIDGCMDVHHSCPNCKAYLGRYRR